MGILQTALKMADGPLTKKVFNAYMAIGDAELKLIKSKPVMATAKWTGEKIGAAAHKATQTTIDQLANVVEMPKLSEDELSLGLSRKGRLAAAGIAVTGAAYSGFSQYQNYAMGDQAMHGTPTPSIQPYMMRQLPNDISAGATGDLVFALNANSQNGFIG